MKTNEMKLNETKIGQTVILSNGIRAEVLEIGKYGCMVTVKFLRKGSRGKHGLSGEWACRVVA